MLVECPNCEATVDARTIAEHEIEDDWGHSTFTFLACPRCNYPVLTLTIHDAEVVTPERIYPAIHDEIGFAVPESIRVAYSEAAACYRARAYTATAIMCRKTLEGIYREHKIPAKSLDQALKIMRDKGIIENRLFEWSDALRIAGNEAAHDVEVTVKREDARDLLDFTKALLEYVFTFKDRFDKFMARRNELKSDPIAVESDPIAVADDPFADE